MTNFQIIETEKFVHGITEDVNTYPGWNRKGKQVRKGEKALFKTTIWKPAKAKKSQKNDGQEDERHLIMVTASFFGASQCEPIEDIA